jgi:uncharacterized protein (DUF488 family)
LTADDTTLPAVYTVGYGARALDDFLDLLRAHDIRYLIDVRSAPYSKFKPEFSKDALAQAVKAGGLQYVYMGDQLGGQPDDPACYADGKVVYEAVAQTPVYQQGIARVRRAHARGLRVALMCSEGKPEMCHRVKLIGETLAAQGVPVLHIDEEGALLTHAEALERLTGGQLTLFGDNSFTSRKRYRPEGAADGD